MTDLRDVRATRLARLPLVPSGPRSGFIRGPRPRLQGVWQYRELLDLLVRRELKSRYKDSVLGFLWSLVRPLALLVVYVVAIGQFLGAATRTERHSRLRHLHLLRADRLESVLRDHRGRHRRHRQQRWPGQEDLPAARSLPAGGHRIGAVQLLSSSSSSSRPPPSSRVIRRRRNAWSGPLPVLRWCWSGRPRSPSCCRPSTSTCATWPTSSRSS